ncbi:aminoglycoside phosphotransferase family protein [Streptomyces sp. NBC_01789]|uniref:aminoglycoside phosphotransferase family protein n=1 Tax=Streptomyces sp. NBC_01789 TaxID=2975941 RepID=UPI002255AAF6|nr:aminoglycoside phosphotransferase family protein [Streptomyces sp. NBC_01789]MCX4448957.1 aminoglycoside phosphotransferase family protein [Streptomyces sp. NBC_01789]
MIVIPEEFARTTIAREGTAGADWLRELPPIVEELAGRWGCAADGEVMYGGVGIIVPVRRDATPPAVLKVSFPHPGNDHEPDAFVAWGGLGAVSLYERDDARYAMLLERAQPATLAEVAEGDDVVTVAARLGRLLAVPAPDGLPRLSDRAGEWEDALRKDASELPHALPRRVLDAAHATVRELGREQPDTLVHGDLHGRNILRAEREPWLAIDPKGYAGDPAYDAGTLLKSRAYALAKAGDDLGRAAHRIVDLYADAAELDRERVLCWAQLHAVQAAFWARRHGFRVARGGPELEWITAFADRLAELLTERPGSRRG